MTIAILDKKYLFLLLLYTLQFVPAGFFYGAIPAILGANNVPMSVIGWVYMMGLIWVGKFLWAPYIDKFTFSFFQGHYRAWLIVIQILLSISMFITAFFPLTENFLTAIILIGIINFISSTQDIAVDGLAINSLRRDQLEYANSMQTVGIFIGTLIGLGLPLYSYEIYDWKTTLIILSLVVLIPTLALNFYKENPKERDLPKITFLEIYKFLKEKNGFKILIMIIPGYWIVERSFPLVQQLLIKNNWSLIDIVISQNIIGSFTGII
ncbi:MAG: MFS transporter, partial [Campylobacterales bacterium]|nr:MFS transporter [Campylobacterales bacterium]